MQSTTTMCDSSFDSVHAKEVNMKLPYEIAADHKHHWMFQIEP